MSSDQDSPHDLLQSLERSMRRGVEAIPVSPPISYDQMRSFAIEQLRETGRTSSMIELSCLIKPSFFEQHVKLRLPKKMPRAKEERIEGMVRELELAITWHILASYPASMVLYLFVDSTISRLVLHEELKAKHEQIEEATKQARKKGGKNSDKGYKDTPRLLRLAIRFLRTMAPPDKWQYKIHATERIGERLSEIAYKYKGKINVALSAETWIEKVDLLIRNDPRALEVCRRYAHERFTKRLSQTSR